jgi:hypothetical protein
LTAERDERIQTMMRRLKVGARFWNQWRTENPDAPIVLDSASLDGMILTGIDSRERACAAPHCMRRI